MAKFYMCLFLSFWFIFDGYGQAETFESLQSKIKKSMAQPPFNFLKEATKFDELAQNTNDELLKGKGKNFIGLYHYLTGNNILAIEYYLKALPYFEKAGDVYFSALVNNNIGAAYSERKNPEEVIKYYNEALSKFKLLNDSVWMSNLYNNLSIQYFLKDDYLKANDYISQAIKIYRLKNDSSSLVLALVNQASTLQQLKRYSEAEDNLNQYFLVNGRFQNDEILSNAYATKARILIAKSEFTEAKSYAEKSLKLRKGQNLKQYYKNSYLLLSEISEKNKQCNEALAYFKQYKIWEDSSWVKEKDKNINELLTSYDVQQKVKTINKLYSENEYQELNLKNIKSQRRFLVSGLVSFLLLAVGLAYFLFHRNKKNKLLYEKNELITSMLTEKDLLLREIHHRVKNNLQVVSSLLNLQSNYITDDIALEAINEGKNRVLSMALIHQNLYSDEHLTAIETKGYFDDLLDQLFESYNIDEEHIKLEKDIDNFLIDVDTMIPLGLITNELISNALKHAFKDRAEGKILFSVKNISGNIIISIKDNGVGVEPSLFTASRSFGNKMIQAFVQKLKANLQVKNDNGTEIVMTIPINVSKDERA